MLFSKSHPVPKGLQKTLIVLMAATFASQLLSTLYIMVQQSATNQNFSAFAIPLFGQITVPTVLVLAAYSLNPRKLSGLEKLFESVVVALCGFAAFVLLSQLMLLWPAPFPGDYSGYLVYELIRTVAILVAYVGVLWYLRRTKRWK